MFGLAPREIDMLGRFGMGPLRPGRAPPQSCDCDHISGTVVAVVVDVCISINVDAAAPSGVRRVEDAVAGISRPHAHVPGAGLGPTSVTWSVTGQCATLQHGALTCVRT